jgi:hypothetical protein
MVILKPKSVKRRIPVFTAAKQLKQPSYPADIIPKRWAPMMLPHACRIECEGLHLHLPGKWYKVQLRA